jgi:hypothetical protein
VVLCGSAAGNPQGNFDDCLTAFRHHQITEALKATVNCSFGVAGVVVMCEASSNPAGYGVRWCDGALGCAQDRGSSREPVRGSRRV